MTRASFNYKTVSGIGSITLENCVETRFKRLELSGNSKQTTTKGINLLPFKVWEKIISSDEKCEAVMKKDGVDITIKAGSVNDVISDIYFIGNGNGLGGDESAYELFKEGDYTFINNTNNQLYLFVIVWRNGEKKILIQGSRVILNNFTINKNDKVRIFLRPSNTLQTYFLEKASVMLCKHTETNLPYEPYTGGKPSPSVEYPQEIVSAGKHDKTSGKYLINVKVTGKNLLNPESKADVSGIYKGWFIDTKDDFITASIIDKGNGVDIGSGYFGVSGNGINAHNGIAWLVAGTGANGNKKITTPNKYFTIFNTTMKTITDRFYVQVEAGKEMTEYEPYTEQTLTIPLDRPLTKWDKIEKRDGVYGIVYKHRTVDDLATLVKDSEPIYGNPGERYFSVPVKDATLNYDYSKAYSECGLYKKEVQRLYVPRLMLSSFIIYVNDTDTIETAKEHLHYKVIYETDSEEFVPLSEETQLALENLHANDGTTIITVDSGEVETGIEVEYAVKN